ncbi:MAG: GUN4 domain-containing protein [Elainellaceae cyanobacterium]
MSFIFISYSRQDQAYVGRLAQALQEHRLPIWLDDRIDYGTTWPRVIQDHLEKCQVFLLVMSPRSENSHWVQCELSLALELKKPIFPLLLDGRRWLSVAAIQTVDVSGGKLPPVKFFETVRAHFPNTGATTAKSISIQDVADEEIPTSSSLSTPRSMAEQQFDVFLAHSSKDKPLIRPTLAKPPKPVSPPIPLDYPSLPLKTLQECNPAKILFIKNVKNPEQWAYSLDWMQYQEKRIFELWWSRNSSGIGLPKEGDLMILHQRARVTHVVEFLDDAVREVDSGFFRWVQAVWMPDQDNWDQLPHQEDVLRFNPKYADGNTHSFESSGFSTFREAWSNLEDFQKYIHRRLIQPEEIILNKDDLASEKGIDYTRLRDLLKAQNFKDADKETYLRMLEAVGRGKGDWIREEELLNFPCADLKTIDRLWVKYSDGRFGFSVQKEIYVQCEGKLDGTYPGDNIWYEFSDRVGWRVKNSWIAYWDVTFNTSAPRGHLPYCEGWVIFVGVFGFIVVSSLASRLVKCRA